MFWFNKSIKELATYSYKLKSTEKEAVQNLFQLYFKDGLNSDLKQRNVKLSFNAKDKQLVNNTIKLNNFIIILQRIMYCKIFIF